MRPVEPATLPIGTMARRIVSSQWGPARGSQQCTDLAELVSDLREYGRVRNLIVAVVDQLQRDEPTYQREFKQLYRPGLRALARGDLVSAAPIAEFGPED